MAVQHTSNLINAIVPADLNLCENRSASRGSTRFLPQSNTLATASVTQIFCSFKVTALAGFLRNQGKFA